MIVLFIVALAIPSLPYLGNTALAQDTLRVAKILDTQGDVKVYRAGGEKSFAAYKGMGLTQGDTIITGANGKVTLEVDKDKEMKIGPNTQLMISELVQSLRNNADKSSFNLKAGQVYTRVKNQLAPGAKYEIRTPTAVMGVRGTQFFVSLSNGVAEVVTLEGQVVVTVSQPVTGPDGTVTMQPIQIQVEPNQIFVQSPDAADPTQYNLATLTSNENLSLFVLETLQEINEQQPDLIDPQLLENLTEQIEQARQEQQQQQEEQQQQQQPQDRGDSSGSGDHTPSITIAELEDLNLACGQMKELPISVTPTDAILNVSSVVYDENTAEVSLEGNTLNIYAGQTPGEITITITASKSGYLPATRSFRVTVLEASAEPSEIYVYNALRDPCTITVWLEQTVTAATVKVYGSDSDEHLLGSSGIIDEYGHCIVIELENGLPSDITSVWVSITEPGKAESMRTERVIPIPVDLEQVITSYELKIVFNLPEELISYFEEVSPVNIQTVKGFVAKENGSSMNALPSEDGLENYHIVTFTRLENTEWSGSEPEAINYTENEKDHEYPFALAFYDANDELLYSYVSGALRITVIAEQLPGV